VDISGESFANTQQIWFRIKIFDDVQDERSCKVYNDIANEKNVDGESEYNYIDTCKRR
jgi:hypothetical protein